LPVPPYFKSAALGPRFAEFFMSAPEALSVKDVTTASFRDDVLAASLKQPVLVDFWAPWCGPCKQLAPIIEKAVAATNGKVALCKMNIDDHPQIAGQLGIQSIPAVIAFSGGKAVDGFVGAVPESQIKAFLEKIAGPGDDALDIEDAEKALEAGDIEGALALVEPIVQRDPENVAAIAVFLRGFVAAGQIDVARDILGQLPDAVRADKRLAQVVAAVDLAAQAEKLDDSQELERAVGADANNHQARFDLAVALNACGDRQGAADHLLEIFKRDRAWNEDGARKQLLQFFESWGPLDPATKAARRKLSSMLFS
jgi:putative thioredoxin